MTEKGEVEFLRYFGVPERFIKYQFPLPGILTTYVNPGERGCCLTGGIGTGKTTAMAALVRAWLQNHMVKSPGRDTWGLCKFVIYPEFIMRLQDSYRHGSAGRTALDLLDDVSNTPLLVVDDLGAEKPTEYVRQATYSLINHREMNLLPTFITSNFPLSYIDENIDPRISSRIAGMCDVIQLEGADRRLKRKSNDQNNA